MQDSFKTGNRIPQGIDKPANARYEYSIQNLKHRFVRTVAEDRVICGRRHHWSMLRSLKRWKKVTGAIDAIAYAQIARPNRQDFDGEKE